MYTLEGFGRCLYLLEKNAMIEKHETMGGSHEENHKIYWKQRLL